MTTSITDRQIKTLRSKALATGDYAQVDLCDRALSADTIDQDGNPIALADMTQDAARQACADAIDAAAAMVA